MPSIFLSYRRVDSGDITGRICDHLVEHFGPDVIFRDVQSIPFGVDFRDYIKNELCECQVLLAVIGPQWLTAQDDQGNRCVDRLDDWVRLEIETALGRGIPVIPLLVSGAELPKPEDLPDCLQPLIYRNSATARTDPDFHIDMDRLIEGVRALLASPTSSPSPPRRLSRENPFGDRGRLSPKQFWGREILLERVFNELKKGSSLSLIGDLQVGKSSLLEMVRHHGPEKLQFESQQFVTINMSNVQNEDDFFAALCGNLRLETMRGFRLARTLEERKKRYIICLDEIERMTNPRNFTGDQRDELKGLADGVTAPLSLVIASRSSLKELFDDDPTLASPLDGLCETIRIPPFTRVETIDFITDRLKGNTIQFTAEQIESLYNDTQGHPAQLQRAARDLYRQLEGG